MNHTESTPWFIYVLSDPRTPGLVRYVGKTEKDIWKRLSHHIATARSGRDKSRCGHWKRALLAKGLEPLLTIVQVGCGPTCSEAEIRWVAYYRAVVGPALTNLTLGGEGVAGWVMPFRTRLKLSRAHMGRPKNWTPDQSGRVAHAVSSRVLSESTRMKMSLAQKGKKQTPEHVQKRIEALRQTALRPESYENRSRAVKEVSMRPEVSSARSERMRARWADPQERATIEVALRKAREKKLGVQTKWRWRKPKCEQTHENKAHRKRPPVTPQARINMRNAHLGKKLPPEQVAKISAANKGRVQSEEERAKRRKPRALEAVAKTAAANRGKKRSEEVRAKMSASHKGVKLSPEHAKNAALAHVGLKRTEESKERTRLALLAYYAKKREGSSV